MDGGTITALVVALIALLVALAQVIQQHAGTAYLIRKCDSSVYGPLPGRGRRVWFWRQFRFKVLYSIPQISLNPDLWPEMYRPSCHNPRGPRAHLPHLGKTKASKCKAKPGEASWVSFYRATEKSCFKDLQYDLIEGDADRCPSDLPTVPMQMNLRDIIVMALMNGMSVTYANLNPGKTISMMGPSGSLSSAEHPILGTLVHFSPLKISGNYGVTLTGKISESWTRRLTAECPVAGRDMTAFDRNHIEELEGRWMKRVLSKVDSANQPWEQTKPDSYFAPSSVNPAKGPQDTYGHPAEPLNSRFPISAPSSEVHFNPFLPLRERHATKNNKVGNRSTPLPNIGRETRGPQQMAMYMPPRARHFVEGSRTWSSDDEHQNPITPQPIKNAENREHMISRTLVRIADDGKIIRTPINGNGIDALIQANNINKAEALPSWKRSNSEIVPWRRPWPPMPPSEQPSLQSSAMMLFRQKLPPSRDTSESEWDYDPNKFPDAPDVPAALSDFRGDHDGSWQFSWEKCRVVVIIQPAYIPPDHTTEKRRWFRWRHDRKKARLETQDDEDNIPLLTLIGESVNAGWRVQQEHWTIPQFVPLPIDGDSVLIESSETLELVPPPADLPPDFLLATHRLAANERLQLSYRACLAISDQNRRRNERHNQHRDSKLIEGVKPESLMIYKPRVGHGEDVSARPCTSLIKRHRGEMVPFIHKSTNIPSVRQQSYSRRRDTSLAITASQPIELLEYNISDKENDMAGPSKDNVPALDPKRNESSKKYSAYVESDDEDSDLEHREHSHTSRKVHTGKSTLEVNGMPNSPHESWDWFTKQNHSKSTIGIDSLSSDTSEANANSSCSTPQRRNSQESVLSWTSRPDFEDRSQGRSRTFRNSEGRHGSRPKVVRFDRPQRQASGDTYTTYTDDSRRSSISWDPDGAEDRRNRWNELYEEEAARRRQRDREHERYMREREREMRSARPAALIRRDLDDLSWFWICQMDIIPGYWATPWTLQVHPGLPIGTTAVIIEALLGLIDTEALQYCAFHPEGLWKWLGEGKSTFPPYARNARGGVVVGGLYEPVAYEQFEQKLPPIRLFNCYDYQVCKVARVDDVSVLNRQLELMGIDSWLSLAGRTPEISDGAANLLRTAPALVAKLMQEFGFDFGNLQFNATKGGLQVIQGIAGDLMQTMEDEDLSEAEQIFTLVALLRTAKVGLCIALGSSTEQIRGYLSTDIQVFVA